MRDSFLFGLPTDSLSLLEGAALSYFHPERSEESLGAFRFPRSQKYARTAPTPASLLPV
jgi:hypothetical protein